MEKNGSGWQSCLLLGGGGLGQVGDESTSRFNESNGTGTQVQKSKFPPSFPLGSCFAVVFVVIVVFLTTFICYQVILFLTTWVE